MNRHNVVNIMTYSINCVLEVMSPSNKNRIDVCRYRHPNSKIDDQTCNIEKFHRKNIDYIFTWRLQN